MILRISGSSVAAATSSAEMSGYSSGRPVRTTAGTPVDMYGDGSQTRDFVYAADVAEAFDRAATAKRVGGEVINVGSGRETSIAKLLGLIGEIRGRPLKVVQRPPREGEVMRSRADPSKARTLLGFEAKVPLREGLRRTLDTWARNR